MHLLMFLKIFTTTVLILIRNGEGRLSRNYDISKNHFLKQSYNFDEVHQKGPSHWNKLFPECGGKQQSPIDIVTKNVKCDSNLTDFVYNGYDIVQTTPFNVIFGERQGVIFDSDEMPISIRGSWFSDEYKFYALYVWTGSVHEIDGRKFPLQVGILLWNSHKYNSLMEAESNEDGVIILNVLVDVNDELSSDSSYQAFSDAFDNIMDGVTEIVYNLSFPLFSLLPQNSRIYYKYHGSYVIPPCHESVNWAIFEEPMYIKQEQMERFIAFYANIAHPGKEMGRAVQPLNKRIVSKYCSQNI